MPISTILLVDDYEPFRRVLRSILQERKNLQVIGEASDGVSWLELVVKLHRFARSVSHPPRP